MIDPTQHEVTVMQPKDRKPVRTTIVGGQPEVRTKSSLPIPDGIEQVIERAAEDEGFRARLLEDRMAAAREAGITLTAAEQMLLASVSEAQLTDLIARAAPAEPQRRHFIRTAALVGGAALTGGCKRKKKRKKPTPPTPTRGIEPDIPGPHHEDDDEDSDSPPDKPQPTRGIRPDVPRPTKGIRPDVPEPKDEDTPPDKDE